MLVELIVLALAVARLTLIAVKDDIFEPIRESIWYISPPENDDATGRYYQCYRRATSAERITQRRDGLGIIAARYYWDVSVPRNLRKPGFWGRVISCPDCLGVWVAAVVATAYILEPRLTFIVALPFSLSMVTSLVARRY